MMSKAIIRRLLPLLALIALGGFDWAGKVDRDIKDLDSPNARVRRQAVERLATYATRKARAHLIKALRDPDPVVQRAAATAAADRGYAEAVPIFLGWLSSWDEEMRIAATEGLAKLGGSSVIAPLVRALGDPEHKVRLKVVEALGRLGHRETVVPLLGALQDTNTDVRKAVVDVLARFKDRRAVIPLMGRLGDPAREVRVGAIKAIGLIGDKRAAPALIRLLRDANADVVDAAIRYLGILGHDSATEALIDMLHAGPTRHRKQAALALARLRNDLAVGALVRALRSSSLRAAAKRALVDCGPAAAPAIAVLLSDPRTPRPVAIAAVEIARAARLHQVAERLIEQLRLGRLPTLLLVDALGAIGDRRAQRPLLSLLDSRSHEVRMAALRALGPVIDARAAEPLLGLLDDNVRAIRLLAIDYLGRLEARVATAPMLRLARGDDKNLARAAVRALARLGNRQATPDLIALLENDDRMIRRYALYGLARNRQPSALPALLRLCRRCSGAIRVVCIQGVGALGRGVAHEEALRFLYQVLATSDVSALLAALNALAAMNDSGIPTVIGRHLDGLPSELQAAALDILGNFPAASDDALPLLLEQLQRGEADPQRGAAAWAIGKLAPASAVASLTRAVKSHGWSVRINATAALARIHAPSTITTLRALAIDVDPYVRANAIVGLGWAGDSRSTELIVDRLHGDRSPWVRLNALRALLRLQPKKVALPGGATFASPSGLARWLSETDPDPRVRAVAARLRRPPASGQNWIGFYLLDQEHKPVRNAPVALVTGSGLVKATYSDVRAQLWEERLDPGHCFIERPPPDIEYRPM